MTVAIGPGTVIERYHVVRLLGTGAMGEVYLATDDALGRQSAVKLVAEQHRGNAEFRARFLREARAMAAIIHPNVVQVFTAGEFDGRPYLAMEYLPGKDLNSLVKESGPLPSPVAAAAVRDAARGLAAAQAAGLVHRDVKPSNLILSNDTVKLTDFGLAKPVRPDLAAPLTAMGFVVGTPDYIAPEQARGDEIDWRVDVYALGASLYYLLTGNPPYRTGIPAEDAMLRVVTRHLRNPAPDPRAAVAKVDDQLAELGLRMMAKSPADRPSYRDIERIAEAVCARYAPARDEAAPEAATDGGSNPAITTSLRGDRSEKNAQVATAPGSAGPQPAPGADRPALAGARAGHAGSACATDAARAVGGAAGAAGAAAGAADAAGAAGAPGGNLPGPTAVARIKAPGSGSTSSRRARSPRDGARPVQAGDGDPAAPGGPAGVAAWAAGLAADPRAAGAAGGAGPAAATAGASGAAAGAAAAGFFAPDQPPSPDGGVTTLPAIPGWLIGVTLFSVVVFLSGLGLFLLGPR